MFGGWKYAAASVIGTSRQKEPGGVCQDSHAVKYLEDSSCLACVVCDGAGSASQAHIGSRLTCDLVLAQVADTQHERLLTESLAHDTLASIQQMLADQADELELPIREFACTMLVAIVSAKSAAFWQIGDGAICFRMEDSPYQCMFWPEKGDYANITSFVTDPNAQSQLQFDNQLERPCVELALFSDGIERLALDFAAGIAHAGFFSGLFPYLQRLPQGYSDALAAQIETFLRSERVNQRTEDDKTLMIASRLS
jgi:hypothetical protein